MILGVVERVSEDLSPSHREEFSSESSLMGANSPFDSLNLITLVVELEEEINKTFQKKIALVSERALSQTISPFSTVNTLADYVISLLQE